MLKFLIGGAAVLFGGAICYSILEDNKRKKAELAFFTERNNHALLQKSEELKCIAENNKLDEERRQVEYNLAAVQQNIDNITQYCRIGNRGINKYNKQIAKMFIRKKQLKTELKKCWIHTKKYQNKIYEIRQLNRQIQMQISEREQQKKTIKSKQIILQKLTATELELNKEKYRLQNLLSQNHQKKLIDLNNSM